MHQSEWESNELNEPSSMHAHQVAPIYGVKHYFGFTRQQYNISLNFPEFFRLKIIKTFLLKNSN